MLSNLLSFAVLAFVGIRLVTGLRTSRSAQGRHTVALIVRGIRWRHVWPVPVLLAVVIGVATQVMRIPGLSWGWWQLLGGSGNPVFGSSDATAGTVWEWLIPLVFMCLLLPALPLFAFAEERIFREGAEGWSRPRRVFKVVQFGLVHALIGIPIGAALTLSIGGAWFMRVYLARFRATGSQREATLESTRAHTAYNGVIVMLVLVGIALDSLLG